MEDTENIQSNNNHVVLRKSTFNKILAGVIIAIAVSAFFGGYFVGSETAEPEKIIISDAKDVLGTNQQSLSQQENNRPIFVSADDDPVMGNPNAQITIIEFSDFQCPFCARFHSNTLPLIEENYVSSGKVKFVYRDFPIQSIHPNAMPAAIAAECADDQGKFWEYHDVLFANQNNWERLESLATIAAFKQYAIQLGLSSDDFNSCLESGKHFEEVNADLQDGRTYGVTGTPGFFIGNENIGYTKVSGAKPYPIFQDIIDEMILK